MKCTVKTLATLSGVTVRTLQYYDEIGLLKPAFIGANNYRYYQEKELLLLQQILFFKELGLSLQQIKKIVIRDGFRAIDVLHLHVAAVQKRIKHLNELLITINNTIQYIKGKHLIDEKDMFYGFNKPQPLKYEKELEDYFNKKEDDIETQFKKYVAQSEVKRSPKTWDSLKKEFVAICTALADLLEERRAPDDKKVQAVMKKHYAWLSNFWHLDKESYIAHAQFIKKSDANNAYNVYDPGLANFIADAIIVFANREL